MSVHIHMYQVGGLASLIETVGSMGVHDCVVYIYEYIHIYIHVFIDIFINI